MAEDYIYRAEESGVVIRDEILHDMVLLDVESRMSQYDRAATGISSLKRYGFPDITPGNRIECKQAFVASQSDDYSSAITEERSYDNHEMKAETDKSSTLLNTEQK